MIDEPDYATLFSVDGREDYDAWFPPRTALAVARALSNCDLLARMDLEERDGENIEPGRAYVLDYFPPITFRLSQEWRMRAVDCFRDLEDDIDAGRVPYPRCMGEQIALWITLDFAESALKDDGERSGAEKLPKTERDYDWMALGDLLFDDHDFRLLWDMAFDGVEDPDSDLGSEMGTEDMRPSAWFNWYSGFEPRPQRTDRDDRDI